MASLISGEPAGAQSFETLRVADGLVQPIFLTAPPHDFRRVFVVEREGPIRILRTAGFALEVTPFLTVANVDTGGRAACSDSRSTPTTPRTGSST